MEDHQGQKDPNTKNNNAPSPHHGCSSEKSEPVRSRWTPKPEQILILESIFNSGMVNPPKDETVRIRKLLEKFGTVGDANVFYWFQNRRSRSRRRQRQMQASLVEQRNNLQNNNMQQQLLEGAPAAASAIPCDQAQGHPNLAAAISMGFGSSSSPSYLAGSSSSCGVGQQGLDGYFSLSPQMGYPGIDQSFAASSLVYPPVAPNLNYQSGYITVFINGIATELQGGLIDMKTMFGEDVMLVHSSGVPVPTNEFGFLMQSLQHGESYILVPKAPQE
ncbi:WUSCHEL-related homeobox 11-like isoform X2 [Lotus japonicus]|uniref:WUSCHEL-related homeobox 11-like isoform X2 n=1 Tax=Lotus japonicus TaxID=34305 RepID=UPI002586ABBF|nr:WUSCHEL-related homeobox 11-like isoform X2 [Lotus japonicus]